jgi:PTS system mannose-specific IIA component
MSSSQKGIGVVVAAHAPLASALCASAKTIVGPDAPLAFVEVEKDASAAEAFDAVSAAIREADRGNGVLLLADLFGGSAANIALAYLGEEHVEVVTGANLAMVIDAAQHCEDGDDPAALAQRVAEAAKGSVVVASALLLPKSGAAETHEATA